MNRKQTDSTENTEILSSQEPALAESSPCVKTSENEEGEKAQDEKNSESIRPEDYALPNTENRRTPQKRSSKLSDEEKDDIDDFIFAKYRKVKRSESKSKAESHHLSPEEDMLLVTPVRRRHHTHPSEKSTEDTDMELVIPKKRGKRKTKFRYKPWWKKLLIILGIIFGAILGLLLILAVTLTIMYFVGKAQLTDYSKIDMTAPAISGVGINIDDKGKSVTYKGKKYFFNTDITSILCMGVDKSELGLDYDVVGTGGQADSLFLVAFNTKTGETEVIAIPRDIKTDIGIYSPEGQYLKTEKHQICLAYAYGDGREKSCENTKTAVERLFYNLPIQSYFAMDLEAISYLNDAVGGVTVTLGNNSFVDSYGIQHYQGETLTLYGGNAVSYLRMRDIEELTSTTQRMDRQINYLNSFTQKAIAMTKDDLGVPLNLLSIISGNSVTDLNPAKITTFATTVITNGVNELSFKKIPGELTSDGTYAEFVVDEESFYEMLLDVYYTPEN